MSDSVTRVESNGREIIIVGTAHVSRDSVTEVKAIIADERPDRVCVEIDASRERALTEGNSWSSLDIFQVIKQRKGFLLLANLVLSSFQRRLGLDLGVKPGEEMLEAIESARELGIPYSLCDREIHTTLRRAWAKSSLWAKNKMLAALLGSIFTREKLGAEEIESLKRKSALDEMLDELSDYLPAAKKVLIDERDTYLAANIYTAEGAKIVAVVGAGHVPGIVRELERFGTSDELPVIDDLAVVPPPGIIARSIKWVIPAIVVGLIGWGFYRSGWDGGVQMLMRWILVNGTLSAIGAAVAFAHPITVIAAFVAAPITSMNPTIGVGFVTGLIEAVVRKPRVEDFEAIQDDILTFRGFFRNRLTRILLVFFFSTVGSAIGTFVALPFLMPGV